MKTDITPIIKVTSTDCNLKCNYCFFKDTRQKRENSTKIMPNDVLEKLIKEICKINNEKVLFIWHGGEPLLAGLDFYQNVINLQEKYKKNKQQIIFNALQTNGTLINDEWAEFFMKNKFRIGISLDGPQEIHDYYRRFPNNKGSFKKTMKGISILRKHKIPIGVLCVVHNQSVKVPKKLLSFFMKEELNYVVFNHCQGLNKNDKFFRTSVNPENYAKFMIDIFELWLKKDKPTFEIRQIKSILHKLLGGEYRVCVSLNECYRFLVINFNGDIYSCNSNINNEKFKFGNICEGIRSILNSSTYLQYKKLLQEIRKTCLKCRWFQICKGGCTKDYYLKDFSSQNNRNLMCLGLQKVFKHIENRLREFNLIN